MARGNPCRGRHRCRADRRAGKMQHPQNPHDDLAGFSRTRLGQGRHRRSPAARDWNCSSLRCPRRVAGSVPEARASQSLVHRPLHPIRNGPVAFSDEGVSLITAWLQVRVLPAPPRSRAQLEFSPSPQNTLDFPRFGPGALARSRSLRRRKPARRWFAAFRLWRPEIRFPVRGEGACQRLGSHATETGLQVRKPHGLDRRRHSSGGSSC